MRRIMLLGTLVLNVGAAAAQEPFPRPAPHKVSLTDAERERFLLEGEIGRRRSAPGGVTNSVRATLRRQGFEHDAHIQGIDEHSMQKALGSTVELDFHDSYRNNVAAYRLDRILGLGMVPVTVVRRDGSGYASFTWWVDDVLMDEKARLLKKIPAPDADAWNRQVWVIRIFDELIYNFDRNLGNLLIDTDWRVWMIDHTRAFKRFKDVKAPKQLGNHCERALLAALRRLDQPTLKAAMADLLNPSQIAGLLERRDFIVQYYDARIAELGEAAVVYDLPPRLNETTERR